jgi:signal transduction histidine kinase
MRWRLTATYAFVVLAAAAALSILATGRALSRGSTDIDRASVAAVLQKDAAGASRYLGGHPASTEVLRFLTVIPIVEDLAGRTNRPVAVAVLGADRQLLAADSCTRAAYAAGNSSTCGNAAVALLSPLLSDPAAQSLLARAVHGAPVSGTAAGHGFAASPILAGGKGPRGALVAIFERALPLPRQQSPLGRFWDQWTASLPQDWLALIALTVLLGTAVGALLSHRLVRRLRQMAAVVGVWSRGNLTPTADAGRRDELGRLATDLNQMAEQMRNLLDTRSELATQAERRRVQRDLHDGIKQELFATSMQLAAARALLPRDADAVTAALDQAHASCRRAQQELAALLDDAPPVPVRLTGLETALSELSERIADEHGLRVIREFSPGLDLSQDAEATIYRVAQEALTNVTRHADASTVTLTLRAEGAETRLRIHDDGRGFCPDAPAVGLGLQAMRERIESHHGRLTIESGAAGTTIDAVLPTAAG